MYYVPDGTERCGFYECEDCAAGFLDLRIRPRMVCPYCGKEVDREIGPDEVMPEEREAAVLQEVIEGEENVKKYDVLLSLAVTGGDYSWI
ncbi:MAG: FYDLN acid domain-containing protein [Solobacterium sp.]|nr:FYDLN acid domain-containing protein [Solobacterium sp.]